MTPIKISPKFDFCTLAGVEDVRVDGECVIGRWKDPLVRLDQPEGKLIAAEFVNETNSLERIRAFVKKYGPLKETPSPGRGFRFSLKTWFAIQKQFRSIWRERRLMIGFELARNCGGALSFVDGELVYEAKSLLEFMALELLGCSPERLKTCADRECPNPYFFATHLKQKYCSDVCAEGAQRKWKRRWWQTDGDKWRKRRGRRRKPRRNRS